MKIYLYLLKLCIVNHRLFFRARCIYRHVTHVASELDARDVSNGYIVGDAHCSQQIINIYLLTFFLINSSCPVNSPDVNSVD